ncbi:MAG: YdiU family protein [Thalassolituus sp.]
MTTMFPFENKYAELGDDFSAQIHPSPVKKPELIKFNSILAKELNIDCDNVNDSDLADIFSGNSVPENAAPLAMAYSGHQFGHLNPQLGDGRAILLGDLIAKDGKLKDVQLKGAGRTPFSRNGDGRCPLGPALREYILCEAMQALGVPTTRALAVVATGEPVIRQQREPGAVFTRVASSHIRVGTFQFFALRQNIQALKTLADHAIERHYSNIEPKINSDENKYVEFFKAVVKNQAELIAKWMNLGFIHGVMNTDNMTISGETIDYGPCAFIDAFSRSKVFSSIDSQGRYAYQNQPAIGQWNLARLAEALLPLFPGEEKDAVDTATAILKDYADWHQNAWEHGMAAKLGFSEIQDTDRELFTRVIDLLDETHLDFTLFFRRLSHCTTGDSDRSHVLALFQNADAMHTASLEERLNQWLSDWQQRLLNEDDIAACITRMQQTNPAVIPRNHRVAEAIAAAEDGDYAPFERLLAALERPFDELTEYQDYQLPPQSNEKVLRTFCGT